MNIGKIRPEKIQACTGFEPMTFAILVQRSQANWELVVMLVPNKPMKWWINDCEYTKVIHLNCRWSIFPCHTFSLIKKSLLLVFVSFLIMRMVFVEEKLTEYKPKWRKSSVLFESWNEKGTFIVNHGSFPADFHKEFSEHDVFHKVQRSSVWTLELLFWNLILTL